MTYRVARLIAAVLALAAPETLLAQPATSAAISVGDLRLEARYADGDADIWRRLAAAEAAAGDLEAAEAAIVRAGAIAPHDLDIQLAFANILMWRREASRARLQADAVRTANPAYPGLAEFDAAVLRRQAAAPYSRALAISAAAGLSRVGFADGRDQTWRTAVVAIAAGDTARTVFEFEADAEQRVVTDVRLSARATSRTQGGAYYVGAGITPNADFREQWRIDAGGDARLSAPLRASLDLRLMHYRSGTAASIGPGLTYTLSTWLRLTGRMIALIDGDGIRVGAALRGEFEPADGMTLFASAARYPDREAGDTRQLRSFAVGGAVDIDARWRVRLTAADEKRVRSYHSQSLNLGLTYRFDHR